MTSEDLKTMQAWSLDRKIAVTQTRITEWKLRAEEQGKKAVVSFSGGKDSTVLLHIARQVDPDMKAVFCDTGTEYPEIVEFVKTKENADIIRPYLCGKEKCVNCRDGYGKAVREVGWMFPSKDAALHIYYARKNSQWAINNFAGLSHCGTKPFEQYERWAFLVDSPYLFSDKCCTLLKERPLSRYAKEYGYLSVIATMASDSRRRKIAWFKTGCNAFDSKKPISKPMSFWMEQDVLAYIKRYNLPYASVYGEIIDDGKRLKMSGQQRTGCVLCPAGCHLQKPSKYSIIRKTHPEMWKLAERLGLPALLDFVGVDYSAKGEDE